MARTSALAVRGICQLDDGVDLSPHIATANDLVTAVCLASGYTDAHLEKIERWLAAHFAVVHYPKNLMQRAEPTQSQIESKIDLGLRVTRYGQQAIVLDYAGNLAAIANGRRRVKLSIRHVGSTESLWDSTS